MCCVVSNEVFTLSLQGRRVLGLLSEVTQGANFSCYTGVFENIRFVFTLQTRISHRGMQQLCQSVTKK